MKRFLVIIFALILCSCATGYDALRQGEGGEMDIPRSLQHSFIDTISISADGSAVALPAYWKGFYLTQVSISTSADDAVVMTIQSPLAGEIGTLTTTSATTGESMPLNSTGAESRYMLGDATYTLTGLGAGTLTLTGVLVQ